TPHFFENKAILERHTERLRELRSLTLWDERLQREEEEFQSEYNLDDLETNVSQLKSEVQNLHTDLNNLEDLSNLKKTAENMLGLEAEVEQLSKEIMTSEINLADSGSVSDPVRTTSELQEIEQDINKIQDENVKIQKMKITKMQQVSQYTKICQSLQDQITERERYLKDATEKMTLAEEAEASSKRAQREKEEVDKQI
ncbi:10222_t:CDS:2, partial [Paraglomus occultum]